MATQESGSDQASAEPNAYREEIEAALEEDDLMIGRVWKAMAEHGRNPQKIKDALDLATVGTIYNCLGAIDTLLECRRLTTASSLATQRARMLRNFAKRHSGLTAVTKSRLEELAGDHDQAATSPMAMAKEREDLEKRNRSVSQGRPGIYVYTLPHYWKRPVLKSDDDDATARTFLKVGMSAKNALVRAKQQSTTELPEPIMVLRSYVHRDGGEEDYAAIEKRMHKHLNAADHNQNRLRGAGKEWFLTHLPFVDSTASLLGLVIDYDHEKDPPV